MRRDAKGGGVELDLTLRGGGAAAATAAPVAFQPPSHVASHDDPTAR